MIRKQIKIIFVLFTALLLASCMDVGDFGATWAKTEIDARLAGKWKQVEIDEPVAQDAALTFVMKDGSYEATVYENGKVEDKPYYPVRSLKIGPYLFAAVGPKEGGMVRYSVEGTTLRFYQFDGDKVGEFLTKKFPVAEFPDLTFLGGTKAGLLNDTTFKAISEIPDTPEYWEENLRYEKQP
jgi:hypothetical protein